MPLYTQFLESPAIRGTASLKRAYWVHGDEPLLVGSAVAALTNASDTRWGVPRIPYSPDMWDKVAEVSSQGLDHGQQLIVIKDADAWTDQDTVRLGHLVEAVGARTVLVMVSKEFPETIPSGSGIYQVRCSLPADPDARLNRACEIATLWARRWKIDSGDLTLRRLVVHCGVDLVEVHSALHKAAFFPGSVLTPGAIVSLAMSGTHGRLLDALLAVDKPHAIGALHSYADLTREAYNDSVSMLFGALTSNLMTLRRLHDVVRPGVNSRDIAQRLDLHDHVVRSLRPFARHYPGDEVDRRLALLSRLDHVHASGASDGVLEALVASW